MFKFDGANRWIACLLIVSAANVMWAADSVDQTGRKLNPYHEQQLQDQIRKCASGVLACSDMEVRCAKQQELCQLLIRSERYDEALQVANNIFKTDNVNPERQAAHHFLMAEIYNRKMKASRNIDEMEKNRQYALSAAQEVVDKKYPGQWGVSEHARALIRDLNDSRLMAGVRQRVSSRQGSGGDSAKEAIADAQRRYLDATQGGRSGSVPSVASGSAQFTRVAPKDVSNEKVSPFVPDVAGSRQALPSEPEVTRVMSPLRTEAGIGQAGNRLQSTGLLTSQPGAATTVETGSTRSPLMVNGQIANNQETVDDIAKNNLAQLLEAARKRKENSSRSTYATGENPISSR